MAIRPRCLQIRNKLLDMAWTSDPGLFVSFLSMTTTAKPAGLKLCVPVSTSETHGPDNETRVTVSGQTYECAEAILTLTEWGWTIGCDGELLPPKWFRRGRRG